MTRFAPLALLLTVSAVRADDAADVRAVLDAQAAAWNKGDLAGYMAGYWNSKDLTFVSGKDVTRGWQATFDRYKKRYQADGKEMGRLTFSDQTVEVLAPGVAVVTGKWELVLSKETVAGRYTLIVKKLDAGWRIVYDHTSG
ncbi:MAG TPA: DUF4440 domain-containing protein [Gemmataceae bacterium]|nr:DUF4440 domain-containing protein [Gemmataceae bacterium]